MNSICIGGKFGNLWMSCLLELQYFPSICYFLALIKYRTIWLEKHENYQKGSLRNKCCIATSGGVRTLSVPLLSGKHQHKPISEVEISHTENWQSRHWKTLATAYGRAPFFPHYERELGEFFSSEHKYLYGMNSEALHMIIRWLNLDVSIQETIGYKVGTDIEVDLTDQFHAQDTGPFDWPDTFSYSQIFEDRIGFAKNLSILDLFFCMGPEAAIWLHRAAGQIS